MSKYVWLINDSEAMIDYMGKAARELGYCTKVFPSAFEAAQEATGPDYILIDLSAVGGCIINDPSHYRSPIGQLIHKFDAAQIIVVSAVTLRFVEDVIDEIREIIQDAHISAAPLEDMLRASKMVEYLPALKPASKHVRLNPHQVHLLRRSLANAGKIGCDRSTGMALVRRGLAEEMYADRISWFAITDAGRARARLKADLPDKSQSQTYGKIPGIWEDLP